MEPTVLIIGAGVIGLACGAELARAGSRVLVIERHDGPGREVSSRNSEVIHAGLYYPPGSLKARCCVEGRALLYERCERQGVPHIGEIRIGLRQTGEEFDGPGRFAEHHIGIGLAIQGLGDWRRYSRGKAGFAGRARADCDNKRQETAS